LENRRNTAVQDRLEQIYREHRQGLFTLALSITRSRDLAEDAVQDAMARLWRSDRRPEGDWVAYVFASVRNSALGAARRRRTTAALPASIYDARQANPAASAVEEERRRKVRDAMGRLPGGQRQAIVLRLYAGLSFRQIAEVLGEPLPTVASRYRRGLLQIKEMLEGDRV
jgi:RNA polymerase sigma-70 factor, ECF subfamily